MYLNVPDRGVPDFLTALGFIAPQGYELDYFLLPPDSNEDSINEIKDEGFVETNDSALKGDNITYLKKDPSKSFSFSSAIVSPTAGVTEEFPKHAPDNTTNSALNLPSSIKSPVKAVQVKESKCGNECTFLLKEAVCGLPRNTLIAYTRIE